MSFSLRIFNEMVTGNESKTKERLRLALLGDALLRVYGVEFGLNRWKDAKVGTICNHVQPLQTNDHFIGYIKFNNIKVPGCLSGKAIADYFEAWVGYLHLHCGVDQARDFCMAYFESQMKRSSDLRGLGEVTKSLLDPESDLETEEILIKPVGG